MRFPCTAAGKLETRTGQRSWWYDTGVRGGDAVLQGRWAQIDAGMLALLLVLLQSRMGGHQPVLRP